MSRPYKVYVLLTALGIRLEGFKCGVLGVENWGGWRCGTCADTGRLADMIMKHEFWAPAAYGRRGLFLEHVAGGEGYRSKASTHYRNFSLRV
jgi:hypothetical protein